VWEYRPEATSSQGFGNAREEVQGKVWYQAVNNAQDAQGFTSYIQSTHSMYSLIRAGERDPGYAVKMPTGVGRCAGRSGSIPEGAW
jgi:hypothetical protein